MTTRAQCWHHDESFRVPGSRLDELLSRLEAKMQQDAGATAPYRMVQVGTVRGNPNAACGGREALVPDASKDCPGSRPMIWTNFRSNTLPMNSLPQELQLTTSCQTPLSTTKNSPLSPNCGNDFDQESSLPILGNRSLPPHRLHEKKSIAVVNYLVRQDSTSGGNEA